MGDHLPFAGNNQAGFLAAKHAMERQGIAGTLVYEAGRRAIAEHNLQTLVIIADEDGDPARLYQSVGFAPTEKTVGVLWWEGRPRDAA